MNPIDDFMDEDSPPPSQARTTPHTQQTPQTNIFTHFGLGAETGGFGGFGGRLRRPDERFEKLYRCYSTTMLPGNERKQLNYGGKIILPASALDILSSLNIMWPMLFSLTPDPANGLSTHAGVLEFIAEEGRCYLPGWMMETLGLKEGKIVRCASATLPLGKFVKLQPQSPEFLEITDPKAVLENALRNFSTLTQGDVLAIEYNDHVYEIKVTEIKPEGAGISIVETDLEVDFEPPLGYVEPDWKGEQAKALAQAQTAASGLQTPEVVENKGWRAFGGSGQRLNGKPGSSMGATPSPIPSPAPSTNGSQVGASTRDPNAPPPPPLELPFGKLWFDYPIGGTGSEASGRESGPFSGKGRSLRG